MTLSFVSYLQVAVKLDAYWWQVRWQIINLPGCYQSLKTPQILTSIIRYQHLRALQILATIEQVGHTSRRSERYKTDPRI